MKSSRCPHTHRKAAESLNLLEEVPAPDTLASAHKLQLTSLNKCFHHSTKRFGVICSKLRGIPESVTTAELTCYFQQLLNSLLTLHNPQTRIID